MESNQHEYLSREGEIRPESELHSIDLEEGIEDCGEIAEDSEKVLAICEVQQKDAEMRNSIRYASDNIKLNYLDEDSRDDDWIDVDWIEFVINAYKPDEDKYENIMVRKGLSQEFPNEIKSKSAGLTMWKLAIENLSSKDILSYLRQIYPDREAISTSEFRKFLNISPSTHQRMRAQEKHPHTISPMGTKRDERILLIDLARWLAQGGNPVSFDPNNKKRGRGSEAWKNSHPKVD